MEKTKKREHYQELGTARLPGNQDENKYKLKSKHQKIWCSKRKLKKIQRQNPKRSGGSILLIKSHFLKLSSPMLRHIPSYFYPDLFSQLF